MVQSLITIQIISQSVEKKDINSMASFNIDFNSLIPAYDIKEGLMQPIIDLIRSREKTGIWSKVEEEDNNESDTKE